MRAFKTLIYILRSTAICCIILLFVVWGYLFTSQGNLKAKEFAEKAISQSTGTTVSIGKLTALPPLWISLKDVSILPLQQIEGENLSDAEYEKVAKEIGYVHSESINIIPLLIDLPLKRLTFLYLGAEGISVTLPQPKANIEEETLQDIHQLQDKKAVYAHYDLFKKGIEKPVSGSKNSPLQRPQQFPSTGSAAIEETQKEESRGLHPSSLHAFSDTLSFTGDDAKFLKQLYTSLPCSIGAVFTHWSLDKVTQFSVLNHKHPLIEEKEVIPPVEIKASFFSIDPQTEKIEGTFSLYPRSVSANNIFNSAYLTFSLLGTFQDPVNPIALKWDLLVDMNPWAPPNDVVISSRLRRTLTAQGDLKQIHDGHFHGNWVISIPKTFDYIASSQYLASSSHAFGTLSIEPNGTIEMQVKEAELNGDIFMYDPKDTAEDEAEIRGIGISYELNLLSLAKASPWKFHAYIGPGTFRLTHEKQNEAELKETLDPSSEKNRFHAQKRKKKQAKEQTPSLLHYLEGWRIDHSFPHITLSSTFFNKHNKALFSRFAHLGNGNEKSNSDHRHSHLALPKYDERHYTWEGFFQRVSFHEIQNGIKKKKPLIELTISSLLEEKIDQHRLFKLKKKNKEWTPATASLKGRILSRGKKESGMIELSSPIINSKFHFIPSTVSSRCELSFQLPALKDVQFLIPDTRLDGSLSFLFSFSPETHLISQEKESRRKKGKKQMRDFIPHTSEAWHLDSALISGSHCTFGDNIHVENFAFSITEDLVDEFYIAHFIVKGAHLFKDHIIELSKAAVKYDVKSGKLSIHNAQQRGIELNTPYSVSSSGSFDRKAGKHGLDSHFSGVIETQGHYGTEVFRSQLSVSLPTSIEGDLVGVGTLSLSGMLGEKGRFHMNLVSRDWGGRQATAQGAIEHIPSSLITAMLNIPHASGDVSGSFFTATRNGVTKGMYKAKGSFIWLERMQEEEALIIEASGGIDEIHAYNLLSFKTPTSKENPLVISISAPVIQKTGRFPFIRIPKNKPIYGYIQGRCDLQSLIAPWMEEEEWAEGTLQVRSTIRGTLDSQIISGEVSLVEGKLDILALGGVLSDITIHGALYGKDIYIDDLRATDEKKGQIKGTGVLLLPIPEKRPFSWKAKLDCSHVEIVNLDYATAVASGEVNLSGSTKHLSIDGKAVSEVAIIDVSKRFTLPIPEVKFVYAHPAAEESEVEYVYEDGMKSLSHTASPFRIDLNISLETKSPLHIKGRGLSSLWKGKASLTGTPFKPDLIGEFTTAKGTFNFAGKDFVISQGNVTFGGDIIHDSRLSVTARADLPHVSARVLLRGTLDRPKISLESNPVKAEKEILSLILFNKELGDISPIESLQLASTAMTLDQSAAPLQFLDSVKKRMGIDKINIAGSKDTINSDISVKVGKQLSQGVTVNVSKGLTSEANRIGLELEIAKNLSAEAEIGDDSEGTISLKWKKDF